MNKNTYCFFITILLVTLPYFLVAQHAQQVDIAGSYDCAGGQNGCNGWFRMKIPVEPGEPEYSVDARLEIGVSGNQVTAHYLLRYQRPAYVSHGVRISKMESSSEFKSQAPYNPDGWTVISGTMNMRHTALYTTSLDGNGSAELAPASGSQYQGDLKIRYVSPGLIDVIGFDVQNPGKKVEFRFMRVSGGGNPLKVIQGNSSAGGGQNVSAPGGITGSNNRMNTAGNLKSDSKASTNNSAAQNAAAFKAGYQSGKQLRSIVERNKRRKVERKPTRGGTSKESLEDWEPESNREPKKDRRLSRMA